MAAYYWELVEKDGTVHEIPPHAVERVNAKMAVRDPILLKTGTVPYAEIRAFRMTNRPYGQALLEQAAQAFHEPIMTGEGMLHIWVKKAVTPKEYASYYSKIPSYHNFGSRDGMILVAFCVAAHEANRIDSETTSICTPEEVKKLTLTTHV